MQTTAVRIYGSDDIRMESFELPAIADDEILVKVFTDSVCMSTHKFVKLGPESKRAHEDMGNNPCIIGHEFCGEVVEVGSKWTDKWKAGEIFVIQPALNETGSLASAGFTYPYCGGNSLYSIVAPEFIENGYMIKAGFSSYYFGSLVEPMSCIARATHAFYHDTPGYYEHIMGLKEGGNMAILAGAGPMGLGAIDYVMHNDDKSPSLLVVTDVDPERLARAEKVINIRTKPEDKTKVVFVNTADMEDPVAGLREITGGKGFDDVLVMAPVTPVIEQASQILAFDGCVNFFAGPTNTELKATINFYNVHYESHHYVGTMGGTAKDMEECVSLMARGKLDPSPMVTHIGGLSAVVDTVINLPSIPGAKKLIYNHLNLPLIALDSLKDSDDDRLKKLGEMVEANHGLWNGECEKYLLANFS